MLTFVCFLLLSFLYYFESLGSVFRSVGVSISHPVSGYTLQNTLALTSRIFVLGFGPLFALLVDTQTLIVHPSVTIFFFGSIICGLLIQLRMYGNIVNASEHLILTLSSSGNILRLVSVFLDMVCIETKKIFFSRTSVKHLSRHYYRERYLLVRLYIPAFLTYIPFYLTWPLVAFLAATHHDYRSFIISLSTLATSFNTMYQSLIQDPYFSRLERHARMFQTCTYMLVRARLHACFFSLSIMLLFQCM